MKKTLATIFIASMLIVSMGGVVSAVHDAEHIATQQDLEDALQAERDAAEVGDVEPIPIEFDELPVIARTGGEAVEAMTAITNWLFVILSIAAVIFIVLAGLQFITAGGNPEAIGQARMKLMYAAVGIVIALLARAVPAVLSSILGA